MTIVTSQVQNPTPSSLTSTRISTSLAYETTRTTQASVPRVSRPPDEQHLLARLDV
jgi:hypothetical protein